MANPIVTGICNRHKVLAPDMEAEGLFKCFREGYDDSLLPSALRKPYSENTARSLVVAAYMSKRDATGASITAFINKILETNIVADPWGREDKVDVDKEKVLKLCSAIESKIIGEKE